MNLVFLSSYSDANYFIYVFILYFFIVRPRRNDLWEVKLLPVRCGKQIPPSSATSYMVKLPMKNLRADIRSIGDSGIIHFGQETINTINTCQLAAVVVCSRLLRLKVFDFRLWSGSDFPLSCRSRSGSYHEFYTCWKFRIFSLLLFTVVTVHCTSSCFS